MDALHLRSGFELETICNYPEAFTHETILFNNISMYFSQDRLSDIRGSLIRYVGSGNITISNSKLYAYGTTSNYKNPIEIHQSMNCNPVDPEERKITHLSNNITLPQNPYQNRFTSIYILFMTEGYNRHIHFLFGNSTLNNIDNSYFTIFNVYSAHNSRITFENNVLTNCSGLNNIKAKEMA
jgi:hypothetical protein